MEKKFDALSAEALALADDVLANIAETEQLSETETRRLTERVLQKAGLSGGTAPVIRRKRRYGRVGVLVMAAALTLAAVTVSVSGYLRYNQPFAEKNFGVLGTRRLEEMDLASPVTYTNGIVDVTVEAVLCDGQYALVLATMEAVEPGADIVWDRQCSPYEWAEPSENAIFGTLYGYEKALMNDRNVQVVGEQCWVTWEFFIQEGHAGETMTLHFWEDKSREQVETFGGFEEQTVPVNDATRGITLEIPLVQNTPVLTLASDAGDTLYLSGYQLYAERMGAFPLQPFRIHRSDGSIADVQMGNVSESAMSSETEKWGRTSARIYECLPDVRFDASDPSTYIGYLDVSGVTALEMNGVMYMVQE